MSHQALILTATVIASLAVANSTQAAILQLTIDGSDAIFLAGRTDLTIPPASDPWNVLTRHSQPTPEEIQETLPPFLAVAGGDAIRFADPAIGGISFYNGFGAPFFGPSGNGSGGSNLNPVGGD